MSIDQNLFDQLTGMGIEPPLARAAATRYSSVEPAIEWCFGAGLDWKPEDEQLPDYGSNVSNTSPSKPVGVAARSMPFQSNNPFRSTPPPDSIPEITDDDVELQKAITMSQEAPEEDDRAVRERSVRASGVPPPSPEPEERIENVGSVFGPSYKEDKEGKMALVPASQAQNLPPNEDDDFHRAVADSLMTASFHSASAQRDMEKPIPQIRTNGAPLVLYSQSGNSTYAANLFQGLFAIPQLREAIMTKLNEELDPHTYMKFALMQELSMRMVTEERSFIEIDEALKEIRGAEPSQLPPSDPAIELLIEVSRIVGTALEASKSQSALCARPALLFNSLLDGDIPSASAHVNFRRSTDVGLDIYSALASILWKPDQSSQTILELSDILTVKLDWGYGAPRELWHLQDKIILDRFLKENSARTAQIRAQQGVVQGQIRRLKEKIDRLTVYNDQNYHDSIARLVKHLETSPVPKDDIAALSREELTAKLSLTLDVLKRKTANMQAELDVLSAQAGSAVFETDDPAFNRHMYKLRAILMHDGALVAGSHLYTYVRYGDDIWWKIRDHEATRVEWDDIASDRTGLFMDGGPYILLYSRDGPRPAPPEQDLISFDSESDEAVNQQSSSRTSRTEASDEEALPRSETDATTATTNAGPVVDQGDGDVNMA
ncbi:hypothetical protein BD324DRAFT_632995 [Kockovaella imperatae]|uniref:USP domain-containing protein n=1 Tax=Kockovaella imperatae TaxID=4999 RepID=A0A1Y1UD73_9TREE|nr:hypothetical protein BD324DRAFT_632995 [Kockovaella imperatae]ORX35476.1 hypothetical protein BD324DRAFT_632995 [Kockovaella imperatae]